MINYKNIYRLLPMLLLALCGCSDDDNNSIDMSQIKRVDDFVDVRDGHTYRCMQVGNQIWMMDNLSYYLPGGVTEGCYTWKQTKIDISNISVDKDNFCRIYTEVANDPNHDWQKEAGISSSMLIMYLSYYSGGYFPQETFLNMMSGYTAFYNELNQKLEEYKEVYKVEYLANALTLAENENGQYSQTYGLLYSLDAARKAVPEGWRLPSDKDWMKLEAMLGMSNTEIETMNQWRGNDCGNYIKEGENSILDAKMGGCNAYSASGYLWTHLCESGYYWTNEEKVTIEENKDDDAEGSTPLIVKEGIIRQVAIYSSKIWRGTTRLENPSREVTYSVRCVKDIK